MDDATARVSGDSCLDSDEPTGSVASGEALRDNQTAGLAVVGDLVEDIVLWAQGPLQIATDNPVTIHRCRGGSAANVAVLAASRVPTRFIGRVGADALGYALTEQLRGVGVEVCVQRSGRTGSIVVLVDENGERTMFPDRGAAAELSNVPVELLSGVRLLHASAYVFASEPSASSARELLQAMRKRGGAVTLDASSTRVLRDHGVERYVELVTELRPAVVFANAAEAKLLELGARIPPPGTNFVIKDGAYPTTVIDECGRHVRVPVPAIIEPQDTTGAGDAFAAGYLSAMLGDSTTVAAVEAGHRLAGEVLHVPGASSTPVRKVS